jgi:hypothetical protein
MALCVFPVPGFPRANRQTFPAIQPLGQNAVTRAVPVENLDRSTRRLRKTNKCPESASSLRTPATNSRWQAVLRKRSIKFSLHLYALFRWHRQLVTNISFPPHKCQVFLPMPVSRHHFREHTRAPVHSPTLFTSRLRHTVIILS